MKKKYRVGVIVYDFCEGGREAFISKRETDDDVQAWLMWLERHGRPEEAETLLESYCSR